MENCVVTNSERTSGLCDNVNTIVSNNTSITGPDHISIMQFERRTDCDKNKDVKNMDSCISVISEGISVECTNYTQSENVTNLHEDIENLDIVPHKVDAFQYMMCNRHKRIGTNSPGKEIDLSTHASPRKKTCQVRRQLLEKWAEQKGASKRKREYDEQGVYVKYRLERRARKLKKMITNLSESDEELFITKKRSCVIIDSDDNESHDFRKEINNETLYETKAKPQKITKNKHTKKQRTRKKNSKNGDHILEIDKKLNGANSLKKQNNGSINTNNRSDNSENSDNEKIILRSSRSKLKSKGKNGHLLGYQHESGKKQLLKVAPVFLKGTAGKSGLSSEVIKAKKQFLLSGVPDSLKKEKEKPQSTGDLDFDIFPIHSHIQQKTPHRFWHLPNIDNEYLIDHESVNAYIHEVSVSNLLTKDLVNYQKQKKSNLKALNSCKEIIQLIKSENQNYPVHRVFRSLCNSSNYRTKFSLGQTKIIKKESSSRIPSGRRVQNKKKYTNKRTETSEATSLSTEENLDGYAMWTEKYGLNNLENIIENRTSIFSLKKWLMVFNENRKRNYDSDSEFEPTDSDSRDSMKLHSNTMILKGPYGSGKTSAVYAVCAELGLNVLEVNASSKRTGKWLLQELQEATQSYQVRRKKNLISFVKDQKEEKSTTQKLCVLLVEDVDVVFDQDEGFIAALMQIISTSKRPIILTTTDENVTFLHKIINNHKILDFSPFTSSSSFIWLQLVCLIEGCHVNLNSLENLLNYNRGDIRKTLLHLQFWVTSEKKKWGSGKDLVNEKLLIDNENSYPSDIKLEKLIKCITDIDPTYFEGLKNHGLFCLPHDINLEIIWWNLSSILNIPNFSNLRLDYYDNEHSCTIKVDRTKETQQLNKLSKLYESLAFIATICNKNKFLKSLERTWRIKPKDGLGLNESMSDYTDEDFVNNLSNTLLSGQVKMYKESLEAIHSNLNVAVPSIQESRWHSQLLSCEEKLNDALLSLNCLERRSRALDYMPALRSILKFEIQSTISGTKRRRFYSYLRQLGIYSGETIYKTASNILKNKN